MSHSHDGRNKSTTTEDTEVTEVAVFFKLVHRETPFVSVRSVVELCSEWLFDDAA